MGKSAKKKPKANPKSEEDPQFDSAPIILSSDDEADVDLSLKIVEKARLRDCSNETISNPSSSVPEVKKKRKKEKKKMTAAQDNPVENVETKEEDGAQIETDATVEIDPSEKSDNIVLRKLLRGPRYFDPPDNSWGNCYNCGEGGHTAANCTSAKRKKPCFVCGSLEHNVKDCNKGKDCFICKKSGHRAKDCPEKSNWGSQIAKICLKCGGSGHEMFTCKNRYSSDDLKEIQCYVCNSSGHLCCVNYTDEGPRDVSCYRCGQLGHSGWECGRVHAEPSNGTPSSCYKCGEEGHMARKCTTTSAAKKEKKKGEYSSPRKKKKGINGNSKSIGARSVPHDLGKPRKRKYQEATPPHQPKHRGGWITEDPADYNYNHNHNYNYNHNHINHNHGYGGSPKTPTRHNDRFHGGGNGGYKSNDRFYGGYNSNDRFHGGGYKSHNGGNDYNNSGFHSNNGRRFEYENVVGNNNGYQQRFSASRFGNSSSSYGKRDYSWDY